MKFRSGSQLCGLLTCPFREGFVVSVWCSCFWSFGTKLLIWLPVLQGLFNFLAMPVFTRSIAGSAMRSDKIWLCLRVTEINQHYPSVRVIFLRSVLSFRFENSSPLKGHIFQLWPASLAESCIICTCGMGRYKLPLLLMRHVIHLFCFSYSCCSVNIFFQFYRKKKKESSGFFLQAIKLQWFSCD